MFAVPYTPPPQTQDAVRELRLDEAASGLLGAQEHDELERWLGWYGALEAQPTATAGELARTVGASLASGRYGAFVLGESHGVPAEEDAAKVLVGAALAAAPVGAFLREEYLYPDTAALDARGVPVLTYANQFKPDADVEKGLARAGRALLVSYTGCAHTAPQLKDYSLTALDERSTWHWPPGKDMKTVRQSLEQRGRRALVVAMMSEEYVWGRIQYLFLRQLAGRKPTREQFLAGADAALAAWHARVEALPRRSEPIVFARDPSDPDLWLGMTPFERSPMQLLAARAVVASDEAAAWLGGQRIALVESLRFSSGAPDGSVTHGYDVLVHAADGRVLERRVDSPAMMRLVMPQTSQLPQKK